MYQLIHRYREQAHAYKGGISKVIFPHVRDLPMSSVAVFSKASPFDALQRWLPKLVLAPSMFIVLVGFYGYICLLYTSPSPRDRG